MSNVDMSKTPYYDSLRRDGASALLKTLMAANGQVVVGDISHDVEQLLNGMAKGIHLGKGQFTETLELVRLVGYMTEMAKIVGALPAFGFSFQMSDTGSLTIVFDPKRLDPSLGNVGLGRVP